MHTWITLPGGAAAGGGGRWATLITPSAAIAGRPW
jgi:hypothetical protein